MVIAVVTLFLVVRCQAVHHYNSDRDRAHAQAVSQARAYAGRLAHADGGTMHARATEATAHVKEITIRATITQTVTIEINTLYGNSPLGPANLTTCFTLTPPSARPAETPCPAHATAGQNNIPGGRSGFSTELPSGREQLDRAVSAIPGPPKDAVRRRPSGENVRAQARRSDVISGRRTPGDHAPVAPRTEGASGLGCPGSQPDRSTGCR
ncbi:hypothetical protein [Actinacidiphila alni]|uniref:hypothetical protein n=1 Tax=Actinacidiphila alni TaxID=380248 RepID=UPI00345298C8